MLVPSKRAHVGMVASVVVTVVALIAGGAVGPLVGGASRRAGAAPLQVSLSPVPGTGAARPRVLHDPGAEDLLRDRLGREPYRTVFVRSHGQATSFWSSSTLGDLSINNQRNLLRAAQVRAFEYSLDRTVVDGQVVPFPTAEARRAAGDQARDVLLQMIDRSRLAVAAPIGGWDRDITSSEEIIASASAFDSLLGAGYPFTAEERTEVVRRIAAVTGELRMNFVEPATANGYADLHQNNHRSKSGAAMVVAAVALADEVPQEEVRSWFDTGADYVDDVLRYMLLTGDGAYGEGPFYFRYSTQNLAYHFAVWERFLGGSSWTTADGLVVPALGRHPLLERNLRWMLDTSVPDGTMAPIDDGNPGRSHFYGILPTWLGATSAGYWQWARTPQPYDVDGNLALGPLAIATYDDSISPAPPRWDPSQVYVEGGTATFRSGWSADDVMAVVLGEHDTASEFGRDRLGLGRAPQSHEHAEPGAFLLHAYGERLALDPGYLTFANRTKVNQPQHHNVVLIDGAGPPDYLSASIAWRSDLAGRPPVEGQATLADWVSSDAGDAVAVASAYRGATLRRRVLFGGERYLVVADQVEVTAGRDLTWMLHGNGGGTSGGTYERTGAGGRWTIGGARLDSAISVQGSALALAEVDSVHEVPYTQERTHTALAATAPAAAGGHTASVQVLYPTRSGASAPTTVATEVDGNPTVTVVDEGAARRVTAARRGTGVGPLEADGLTTDGDLLAVERSTSGDLVSVWADGATWVDRSGRRVLAAQTAGTLAARVDGGATHLVAPAGSASVDVSDLPAAGAALSPLDGACRAEVLGVGTTRVTVNASRTATLGGAGGRPAADAGVDRRVEVGAAVRLDGGSSCDPDGQALDPRWELVSAPAGSAWSLSGGGSWTPTLVADRAGPFRVRLVVTDASGRSSTADEVLIKVGPQCADGIDDDLDGLIDSDDPDCDGPPSPPPPETPPTTIPETPPPTTPATPLPAVPTPGPVTPTTSPTSGVPSPTATERFVTLLFRDVLGRFPDAGGLAWWTSLLDRGATRSDVVARFRRAPEITERIVRTHHEALLDRRPQVDELVLWTVFLRGGGTVEEMTATLIGSGDYLARAGGTTTGFVGQVHRDLLDRSPTADEARAGARLAGEAGRVEVARYVLGGGESRRRRVSALYTALLHRAPDASGLAWWSDRLAHGATLTDLLFSVAATPEYAGLTPRSGGPDVLAQALAPGGGRRRST